MNLCESLGVSWGLWASLASSLRERLGQIPGPPIGWGHRGSVPTWSSVGTPHWLAQSAGASPGLGGPPSMLKALLRNVLNHHPLVSEQPFQHFKLPHPDPGYHCLKINQKQ